MSTIRFICISDLHLGDKYSLLTRISESGLSAEFDKPSKTLLGLSECIKAIAASQNYKPSLVLVGDALELALARTNEALAAFRIFIETMLLDDDTLPFDRIIFIPGNHDHHLWEATREATYIEKLGDNTKEELKAFAHTWRMFCLKDSAHPGPKTDCAIPDFFLSHLLKSGRIKNRAGESICVDTPVITTYPNFALRNGQRCVIITHGHYIEPLYRAMSELDRIVFDNNNTPLNTEDLERQNFAWIDFFWSSLGRQGKVGRDVERTYYSLNDRDERRRLAINLLCGISKKHQCFLRGVLPHWPASHMLDGLMENMLNREKSNRSSLLGKDAVKGLFDYIDRYAVQQYREELKAFKEKPDKNQCGGHDEETLDLETTLIFGHTHSPFACMAVTGQKPLNGEFKMFKKPVGVYNTGGWVVEEEKPNLTHGASLVLIDENLECAAIEMFMERTRGAISPIKVSCADGNTDSALAKKCSGLIEHQSFRIFSEDVAFAVKDRMGFRRKFAERIRTENFRETP